MIPTNNFVFWFWLKTLWWCTYLFCVKHTAQVISLYLNGVGKDNDYLTFRMSLKMKIVPSSTASVSKCGPCLGQNMITRVKILPLVGWYIQLLFTFPSIRLPLLSVHQLPSKLFWQFPNNWQIRLKCTRVGQCTICLLPSGGKWQ